MTWGPSLPLKLTLATDGSVMAAELENPKHRHPDFRPVPAKRLRCLERAIKKLRFAPHTVRMGPASLKLSLQPVAPRQ